MTQANSGLATHVTPNAGTPDSLPGVQIIDFTVRENGVSKIWHTRNKGEEKDEPTLFPMQFPSPPHDLPSEA